jgi:hypothetical protein
MGLAPDLKPAQLVAIAALLAMLAYCGYTQHTRGVIPNRVTGPAFIVASATAPLFAGDDWPAHLAAAVVTAIVLAAAALLTDEIGLGVVKLLVVVAVVIGPAVWLVIVVAAIGSAAKSAVSVRTYGDGEVNPVPQIAGGVVIVVALGTIV